MLPADPKGAQRIVGNAISPYHAALMLQYTGKVLKERTGLAYDTMFTQILKEIDEQLGGLDDLQLVHSQGTLFLCQPGETELTGVEPVSHKRKQCGDTLIQLVPSLTTQVDEQTQPFRLVLEGDPVDTGSSAMIDVSGRLFPLPHPTKLMQWKQWFHLHLPITSLEGVMVRCGSTFLDDHHFLQPSKRYVLVFARIVKGAEKGDVRGIVGVNGEFRQFPMPSYPMTW